jgi:predicted O-linked N-acetylglucosamine transferase (SPINDLY family)
MSAAEQLTIAKRFARAFSNASSEAKLGGKAPAALEPAMRAARLRIGYVSPDMRLHPIAYLLTELWERHDRERFEVYAYSIGPGEDSPLRQRIENAFEHFVDAGRDSAEATAERIRADGIQMLIDLNGFTFLGRPEIFASRPAPVQMHWLGYLGTLGADWCDYIITDRYATPPEMQPHFTERFLYLAGGYTPSDTRREIDPAPQSRSAQGLPDDAIVFCCFNNTYKIGPVVFDAWMRILSAVPNSVLWLSPTSDAARANLLREASARGVAPERLVFAPRAELGTYLARLRLADLFLDTWPYNAGTTANDALYVGLPLLTCAGETMAGRVAASQLLTIGMPELVTRDLEAYEAVAIALGRSSERLAELRRKLAVRRTASCLFDMERYTRGFEDALVAAWNDYERRTAS